ncbi:interleukin-13 receptor subunit alpha-1 [Brachionichthys hirsutus]|uniref:interleukin-13 receptor subunit alpha-1 n=1 Tax=Brachionichthys hirsutus TaxID=412623 RepID=UPI00360500AC
MRFALEFSLFTRTAMMVAFHCHAESYPPPTGLSYQWLDQFTVGVAWVKPSALPDDRGIWFFLDGNRKDNPACLKGHLRNYRVSQSFLTEETHSDHWTYNIWTVKDCQHSPEGAPATIRISTPKPRAVLVKDFKCAVHADEMKCSWVPARRSLNLTLSYRICSSSEESIGSLETCDEPRARGARSRCDLRLAYSAEDVCVAVETDAAISTFKAPLSVPPPKVAVREVGDHLQVSATPPETGERRCWTYEFCYIQCNKFKLCQNTSAGEAAVKVPYERNCLYEFRSRVRMSTSCSASPLCSDFGAAVSHGSDKRPDLTLVAVSIVVPMILSVCVILSCCWYRRRDIIYPVIPDPSAIFKEMMSGNRNLKIAGRLYAPVPERIEPCSVSLASQSVSLASQSVSLASLASQSVSLASQSVSLASLASQSVSLASQSVSLASLASQSA